MKARAGRGISLRALLLGRCPRCHEGPIFPPLFSAGALSMHKRCSVCDLDFEPDTGYFLGAMYFSYGIGVLTILPVAIAMALVIEASLVVTMVVAVLQTVLTMLFMYRASRVAWLHIDQAVDPHRDDAGA